ncbi:protein strawberry notch-like [Drosophila obscura]|uniref:protein strawberry notch-like n=1 Tax=Drosophila obscura TaxID=7282 RepID=UPI001BB10CFF|nr:protein strawberry notch-like [Drosophila obscura]
MENSSKSMRSKGEEQQKRPPAAPLLPLRGGRGDLNVKSSELPAGVCIPNKYGKNVPQALTDGLIKQFTIQKLTATMARSGVTKRPEKTQKFTFKEFRTIMASDKNHFAMHTTHSEPQIHDALATEQQELRDEQADYEENRVGEAFVVHQGTSKLQLCEPHSAMAMVEKANLSAVALPDISYDLKMPGLVPHCLSTQQLEAVVYACQTHQRILPWGERAGFLLGDGPGVGKGRTIAGIIYSNFLLGRKRALWISISNILKSDVERDLKDIGGSEQINVVVLDTLNYWRISSEENDQFKTGIVFCTYTSLMDVLETADAKYDKRFHQVCSWLGKTFDGVIVFDECDNARHLSRDNVTVLLKLQKQLPNARVVYVSATEPNDPKTMAFMPRLGLWGAGTAYPKFENFTSEMQHRSPVSMKLLCMDMKLRGSYMARQLSFKNVTVRIDEVVTTRKFFKIYERAAKLWAEMNRKWQAACRFLRLDVYTQQMISDEFWSAHQQFFRHLCLAGKVENALQLARDALDQGKAVVISLQSTEESWTLEHLKEHKGQLKEPVSNLKLIMKLFVEKHFPAPKLADLNRLMSMAGNNPIYRATQAKRPRHDRLGDDEDWAEPDEADEKYMKKSETDKNMPERILKHLHDYLRLKQNKDEESADDITDHDVAACVYMRYQLLTKIDYLGRHLPASTMDKLKAKLGGHRKVAEITTRLGGMVCIKQAYKYMPRCKGEELLGQVNETERQCFMADSKQVAIVSETASKGISLHSDKAVANQRQRLHIVLELSGNLDQALQQLGRTHRSNQLNSPEYVLVIADLIGERRTASTVAERLKSLGAVISDNRRSTDDTDLAQIDLKNVHGPSSLYHVIQQMAGKRPIDPSELPRTYTGNFRADCGAALGNVGVLNVEIGQNGVEIYSVAKNASNIDRFIHRVRGCCVEMQSAIFQFFIDNMYRRIAQMKRSGCFNIGLLDLRAHKVSVRCSKQIKFTKIFTNGAETTQLHTLQVERGMPFETALRIYRKSAHKRHEGFYELKETRGDKRMAILCLEAKSSCQYATDPKSIHMQIYRPNIGLQVSIESLESVTSRYVIAKLNTAQRYWQKQYELCLNTCAHIYWNRTCPFPHDCMEGKRLRTYHVLSGRVLPYWSRITQSIEKNGNRIQMISAETAGGQCIVGIVVPNSAYNEVHSDLSSDVTKVEVIEAMAE